MEKHGGSKLLSGSGRNSRIVPGRKRRSLNLFIPSYRTETKHPGRKREGIGRQRLALQQ